MTSFSNDLDFMYETLLPSNLPTSAVFSPFPGLLLNLSQFLLPLLKIIYIGFVLRRLRSLTDERLLSLLRSWGPGILICMKSLCVCSPHAIQFLVLCESSIHVFGSHPPHSFGRGAESTHLHSSSSAWSALWYTSSVQSVRSFKKCPHALETCFTGDLMKPRQRLVSRGQFSVRKNEIISWSWLRKYGSTENGTYSLQNSETCWETDTGCGKWTCRCMPVCQT